MRLYTVPFLTIFAYTLLAGLSLSGQSARSGGGGERAFAAVPMVGTGTWEDPKRPAFMRESGIPFRYQVSDDGQTALVELTPRSPLELRKLETTFKEDPRVRVFRSSTHKLTEITAEFRKLKRDFQPDSVNRPQSPGAN